MDTANKVKDCPACEGKGKVVHGPDGVDDCQICKGDGKVAKKYMDQAGTLDAARGLIRDAMGKKFGIDPMDYKTGDVYVTQFFEDRAIVEVRKSKKPAVYYSVTWMWKDADKEAVTLGDPEEVKLAFVAKSEAEDGVSLTGPFIFKAAKKQIAYAPVLVPGEPDSDGEVLTASKIEQVSHEWMANYRQIDINHTLNSADALPVESYLTTSEMAVKIGDEEVKLPKGTWVMAAKFNNKKVWQKVMKGELGGFSVMGVKKSVLDAATKSDDVAYKRTLLEDLGEDWVATHVSVVTAPAVPKAKWFALKSDTLQEEESHGGFVAWLKSTFGATEPSSNKEVSPDAVKDAFKEALQQEG